MTTSDDQMTDFDSKKSRIERLLDRVIESLARTYPEQTSDAMSDYATVLRILSPVSSDMRIKPVTDLLKRLYVYPNRPEHNDLLLELHEIKEMLHEFRINDALTGEKGLGAAEKLKIWPWLVVSALAIIFLLRAGA